MVRGRAREPHVPGGGTRRERLGKRAAASFWSALIAILALVGAPQTAFAHDQLLSSSPADGDVLASSPTEIRLAFTDDVQDIGAAIVLTDAAGAEVDLGDIAIDGPDIVAPIPSELASGGYEFAWRAASADGHPITGVVSFQVEGASPTSPSDAAASDASPSRPASAAAVPPAAPGAAAATLAPSAPVATPAPRAGAAAGVRSGAIALVGAGLAVAAGLAWLTLRRRTRPKEEGTR